MRILLTLVLAIVPAVAQIPLVSLLNASRPGSDFQIGDRFEIVITATPNQVVSDKLSRQLLNGAGVVSIAVQSGGVRRLLLAGPRMARTPYLVDLREGASPLSWSAPSGSESPAI